MGPEAKLERYLLSRIKALGGLAPKMLAGKGWPDRLVILDREHWAFVELKAPGGVLSPMQKYIQDQLRNRGVDVFTLWSKDEIDNFMEWLEQQRKLAFDAWWKTHVNTI